MERYRRIEMTSFENIVKAERLVTEKGWKIIRSYPWAVVLEKKDDLD
jgi:hypothetical protein